MIHVINRWDIRNQKCQKKERNKFPTYPPPIFAKIITTPWLHRFQMPCPLPMHPFHSPFTPSEIIPIASKYPSLCK